MNHFMPSFLLCNLLISGIIGALLVGKRLLRNSLSSRMQYNLWFLLLGLLAVPFLFRKSILHCRRRRLFQQSLPPQ